MAKRWSYKEICFLKDSWGDMQLVNIANKLNRTIDAVKIKAQRIGLKDQRLYMSEISLNQLVNIIGNSQLRYIADTEHLPFIFYRKIVKDKIKVVDMDKFWGWLDKNRHAISLHNTDKYSFGYEPDWVEEKRQADKRAKEYSTKPWSAAEDEQLKQMLKSFKYGYREISLKLKRTEGAIKRRIGDLKVKERPLKADNLAQWSKKEIETVKKLYLKGYKTCIIAEYVNRSALAIYAMIERHNFFKN